jgi:hypothetical protein
MLKFATKFGLNSHQGPRDMGQKGVSQAQKWPSNGLQQPGNQQPQEIRWVKKLLYSYPWAGPLLGKIGGS